MELEILDLIGLLAGFLAGVVTFEFCIRSYGLYCDRRDIREATTARERGYK